MMLFQERKTKKMLHGQRSWFSRRARNSLFSHLTWIMAVHRTLRCVLITMPSADIHVTTTVTLCYSYLSSLIWNYPCVRYMHDAAAVAAVLLCDIHRIRFNFFSNTGSHSLIAYIFSVVWLCETECEII